MYSTVLASILFGGYVSASAIAGNSPRAACNRDNCLRAVVASSAFPGTNSAMQDCASFFKATVTPATVYVFNSYPLIWVKTDLMEQYNDTNSL